MSIHRPMSAEQVGPARRRVPPGLSPIPARTIGQCDEFESGAEAVEGGERAEERRRGEVMAGTLCGRMLSRGPRAPCVDVVERVSGGKKPTRGPHDEPQAEEEPGMVRQ